MSKSSHNSSFNIKKLTRKQTVFTTAAILIGIVFIFAVLLVTTRRLVPKADVPTLTTNADIIIPSGQLKYKVGDQDGVATSNSLNITILPSFVQGTFLVQGLPASVGGVANLEGTLTVFKAGTSDEVAKTTVSSNEAAGVTGRKFVIDSNDFADKVVNATGPFDVRFKLKYYLASKETNVTDIFNTVQFSQSMRAGDANDDNKVNGADLAIINAHLESSTTAGPAHGDVNYDGKVNGADLAIINSNLEKTGE